MENKNKGLFERCKQYAEGIKPTAPLAGVGLVRDASSKPLGTLKVRGTQFRERDYADPNAEMSEEDVSVYDPTNTAGKKKRKDRSRAAREAAAAAGMSSDSAEDDENETEEESARSPPKKKARKVASKKGPLKIPNVPTAIKKNLQPVSVTEVPPEVKKAFQNVLKEKQKLQPIPSAAVPLAVQRAVRQDEASKAAAKKVRKKCS